MPEQGLLDVLRRSGGLVAVSRQLDVSPAMALAAVSALMPLVRGGFRRRVEAAADFDTGIADLLDQLDALGGGGLAGRVLQNDRIDPAVGQAVLVAVFGSDTAIPAVIGAAAQSSEIDSAVVEAVLPLLTILAAGYVAARAGRMSAIERLAELGPLFDLAGAANPLDGLA